MQKYELFSRLILTTNDYFCVLIVIYMNSKVGVKPISCDFFSFNFVCIMSKEHLYECEDKTRKNNYSRGDFIKKKSFSW